MRLIDDVGFDGSYSFLYSPRPGTPAADLRDAVPREVGEARLARLQQRIETQYAACSTAMVGTVERALVTGRAHRDSAELSARTERNRVVNFAGSADLIGCYADVRITAARAHSLRGELAVV